MRRILPALTLLVASAGSGAAGFVELVTPSPGGPELPSSQRADPESVAVAYVAACLTALRATPQAKRRAIGNCEDVALGLEKPGVVTLSSVVRRDGRLSVIQVVMTDGSALEYNHATRAIRKKPRVRPPQKFGPVACQPVAQQKDGADFLCSTATCTCRWREDRLLNCTGC
jgi:hypothetical protein